MKTFRLVTSVGVVAIALLVGAAQAQAAPIFLRNATGLANPEHTITFSELGLADGTVVTNQYAALGITFDPGFQQWSVAPGQFGGIDGGYVRNYVFAQAPQIHDPFSMKFTNPVSEAALALATNNPANAQDTTSFSAYLNGVEVAGPALGFFFPNLPGFAYIGITNVVFDEIRFNIQGIGAALIDNVQFSTANVVAVPEPALLALVGAGLALAIRRRARQQG